MKNLTPFFRAVLRIMLVGGLGLGASPEFDPTPYLEIERRDELSVEEFRKRYLRDNRPVILTSAVRQWKALSRWTPEFFKAELGDIRFTINEDPNQEASYKDNIGQVEYTMARFIDRVLASTDENPAPYFRNRVLSDLFPSLKGDIGPLPEYFEPNWLSDWYLVKYVGIVLNRGADIELYIGGKGGAFPVLHYDGLGTHAFLIQIYGRKQFIVYPPSQELYLYPSAEKRNLSMINSVERPDLNRFPLFTKAVPIKFVLEPGELLFVPGHWWHTTKMLTPSITLSINTADQSNWGELVDFVARGRSNRVVSLASRVYLSGVGILRSWRDRDLWRPNKGEVLDRSRDANADGGLGRS